MKLTKRIKQRIRPSVIGGFTRISHLYMPPGYYQNRGIRDPFSVTDIGHVESVRFAVSPVTDLRP